LWVTNEKKRGTVTLLHTAEQAIDLAEIATDARDYVAASRAENTTRVYRTGWAQFTAWCDEHRVVALPAGAETVALYVADLAKDAKPATIDLRLAAISAAHRAAGYDSPTKEEAVRLVRRGVRRTLGTAQRQVHPVTVPDLRTMLEGLGSDSAGCRDRALLLLGFAGALRRSELVDLDVADITEGTDGLTVRLRHSKTDQEGAGRTNGIPYGSNPVTCPVRAWRAWLELSGITEGHAFRPVDRHGRIGPTRLSAPAVALVLKRHAVRAGLDPREVAAHSLRAGLATSAAAAGVPERVIAEQTGHKGRPCFAVTSGRARCFVRTPPARSDCRAKVTGRRAGHGRARQEAPRGRGVTPTS
jgi:integrase